MAGNATACSPEALAVRQAMTDPLAPPATLDLASLQRHALRLYQRYAVEIVEGLGFCPWASEARRRGQVHVEVVCGDPSPEALVRRMADLAGMPAIAIGLLVLPTTTLDSAGFQRFAAQLREIDRAKARPGTTTWAVADFHPQATADLESAQRLVPFIRRTPDPTLQLVRHSVLERVRKDDAGGTRFVDLANTDWLQNLPVAPEAPLHARVASKNLDTVRDLGAEAVEARIREIHDDRKNTYRRLGLPAAPWESA